MMVKQNPQRRPSLRLHGYDYSEEGAYFVTIVTHQREPLFGKVVDDEMVLNNFGKVVKLTWNDLESHNINIGLGEFIVMPNHVHGIIHLYEPVGEGSEPSPTKIGHGPAPMRALPEIVRQFITFSAKRINQLRGTVGTPVWQRNYYDHIIRSEKDYDNIVFYIETNPSNWSKDEEFLQ